MDSGDEKCGKTVKKGRWGTQTRKLTLQKGAKKAQHSIVSQRRGTSFELNRSCIWIKELKKLNWFQILRELYDTSDKSKKSDIHDKYRNFV